MPHLYEWNGSSWIEIVGAAGPNSVSTSTATTLNGLIKGNATNILTAVAGTDYQAPLSLTTTGTSGAATLTGATLNVPQYSGGSGTPGGSSGDIQYNNAGAFGGVTVIPIANGGTNSATQNFVDLTTAQTVGGAKTFTTSPLLIKTGSGTQSDGIHVYGTSSSQFGFMTIDPSVPLLALGYWTGAGYGITKLSGTLRMSGDVVPDANLAHNVGLSSLYFGSMFTQTLNLNSTFSISGSTAGVGTVTGNLVLPTAGNFIGLQTSAPTHCLTLGSTATGIALYNTSDQTTNYERARAYWSGNSYILNVEQGGTGVQRLFNLASGGTNMITINNAGGATVTAPKVLLSAGGTSASYPVGTYTTLFSSSFPQNAFFIAPTINQSATASYTALLVNPTETATGSGAKLLMDLQVGGTSKFKVSNTGVLTIPTGATNNYVLTSDASGNATWQAAPGGGSSGITRSVNTITTATTAGATTSTDYAYFITGTTTLTLPTAVSNTNRYTLINSGTNTVTVATTSSQTITNVNTTTTTISLTPGESVDVLSNNSNWWII